MGGGLLIWGKERQGYARIDLEVEFRRFAEPEGERRTMIPDFCGKSYPLGFSGTILSLDVQILTTNLSCLTLPQPAP